MYAIIERSKSGAWVAKINGTDTQYGLKREFVQGTKSQARNSRSTLFQVTEPGLYQIGKSEDDGFRLVLLNKNESDLVVCACTEQRARAIVTLLDAGTSFAEARQQTAPVKA